MTRAAKPSPSLTVPDDASIAGEEDPGASLDAEGGETMACNRCAGTGRYHGDLCPTCGGSGHVMRGAGSG
jgi:hypothetical protein